MADLFPAFLFAAAISFIGSLQPGPVNLSVIYAGYHFNLATALRMAIGGALPELFYCTMAMLAAMEAIEHPPLSTVFNVLTAPLLVLAGFYLICSNETAATSKATTHYSFFKGMLAGGLNPLLLPFWTLTIVKLRQENLLDLQEKPEQIAFVIGSAAGACLLLVALALLTHAKRDLLQKLLQGNINKVLGLVCIILAVADLVRKACS